VGKHGQAALDAAQHLRSMIIGGELRPGGHLREVQLAEQLEVSRNTLREAFRMLAQEGLIVHQPNSGAHVTTLSARTIGEIYALRRLMGLAAIREGVASRSALAAMRTATAQAHEARERGDGVALGTADLDFHRAIIALAGNSRMSALHETMLAELRLAFGAIDDPASFHASFLPRNDEILARLTAGDRVGAERLLAEYLELSETSVLAAQGG